MIPILFHGQQNLLSHKVPCPNSNRLQVGVMMALFFGKGKIMKCWDCDEVTRIVIKKARKRRKSFMKFDGRTKMMPFPIKKCRVKAYSMETATCNFYSPVLSFAAYIHKIRYNTVFIRFHSLISQNTFIVFLLENNINYILKPHLKTYTIRLRWFFDMVSKPWSPSDHEFEFHHPHLFDKN